MSEAKTDLAKVVFLGDAGVGKTAIVKHKEKGEYDISAITSTVQPSEIKYTATRGTTTISVSLWDTPGQYNYRNIVKTFIRNALCVVLVFDLTNIESFDNLVEWYNYVNENIQPKFLLIIGNKSDLDNRVVDTQIATEWAESHSALYIETSALQGDGIEVLFTTIDNKVFELKDLIGGVQDYKDITKETKKENGCC